MATELECSRFWFDRALPEVTLNPSNPKWQEAKLEYQQKCGMYDKDLLDCIQIDNLIQSQIKNYASQSSMFFEDLSDKNLPTNIVNSKKKFADKGCVQKLEKYRQAELGKVIGKFSNLDKARIEAESIYERNQRIFFGGLLLLGGIVMITMFSKKK
jgi:hypothetical protein